MKKKGSKKVSEKNSKFAKKEIKEEKQEQKKPEIKKQESKPEFFDDSESFFSKTSNNYGEEALESIVRKKRFMPILNPSTQELEESFEEPGQVNLEKSLKNVPSSNNNSELSPSYATSKNLEYDTYKYDPKPSSSYETTTAVSHVQNIARGPGESTWTENNMNTNPESGINQAIGRNKDYEKISRKKDNTW
ncbi:MAG: hypothetical protein AABW67_05575 [Nanoarchaeota archaeon]